MQLNGITVLTMAASEPPELPPRNPDKINATLKQINDNKINKSLDATNVTNQSAVIISGITPSINRIDASDKNRTDNNQNLSNVTDSLSENKSNSLKESTINEVENEVINEADSNVNFKNQIKPDIQPNIDDNKNSNTDVKPDDQNDSIILDQHKRDAVTIVKLRQDNEHLTSEIVRLKKLFENSADGAVGGVDLSENSNFDEQASSKIERLETELMTAKEQINHLKIERRKLKSDKGDLLLHVKQLCSSLHDKEQELRDFIRTFEQRIRETESNKNDRERERWSLLKHAREESERSMKLAAQLNAKDLQLQRAQEQLNEARRQLSGCMSDQESLLSYAPLTPPSGLMTNVSSSGPSGSGFNNFGGTNNIGDRGSCSADSGVRVNSDRESAAGDLNLSDGPCDNNTPCITVDPDTISLVSSHMYQFGTPKERSPTLSPLNAGTFSRSIDSGTLSRSFEQLASPTDSETPPTIMRRLQSKTNTGTLGSRSSSGRGGSGGSGGGGGGGGSTWGSISRVFARTRHRNKNMQLESIDSTDFQWSPLTEEGYAEKLRLLREASSVTIDRWRASQVLAWLEVALGMPQYSARCAENVKSGKVLLELNDGELESGLGLTHPMHRKKLRLAIEEHRRPELIRYPTIGQLGHTWVASEWLPDIGLPQYAESFLHSLVDARMLDTLSKKELEKFLNVNRKFHQASIVHGIHVLRILKYDRQSMALRRLQSENMNVDPIVWTNQRFIQWIRSIDLAEYADNLKDSGIHGGLVVLEPSVTADTIASALGIPPAKHFIRRHLATEFEALILPARTKFGQRIRTGGGSVVPITGSGGLQQQSDRRHHGSLRFNAWKGSQGSLSRVFRLNKSRTDPSTGTTSTSPTPSYSSSSENGICTAILRQSSPTTSMAPPPLPTTLPPPPSHRVSAPPMETNSPTYAQIHHRRVKSINDIEIICPTTA